MNVYRQGWHIWWQKPKIRTDENADVERKASWLELFYDLIFVTILTQLSHSLFTHISFEGAGQFIFLFIPAWWIWNSITYYNERYETNDIRHRIMIFLNMIPLAGIAYSVHGAFSDKADIFALSYILSRVLLIYLWLTAGESKLERKLSAIFAFGFTVSVIIWTISLFLYGPIKYVVWGLGLFIDILTPLFTLDTQSKLPKISISHIPERFGLLIILTIGETVVSSVNVLAANGEFTLYAVISGVLGLCISFLIWWLYIDHVMYRVFKRNVWHILSWSYLHLPLTISITAVGSGILAISNLSSHNHSSPSVHWLLCGSVASVLIFTAFLGLVSENKDHHFGVIDFHKKNNRSLFLYKIISAVLALIAGMLGSFTNSLMLLVILVIILAISPIQGLTLWIKSHLELSKRNEKITQTIK